AVIDVRDEQARRIRPDIHRTNARHALDASPGGRSYTVNRDAGGGGPGGRRSKVAGRAHSPEVAGSNPAPATRQGPRNRGLLVSVMGMPGFRVLEALWHVAR